MPRLFFWLLLTVCLLLAIAHFNPEQLPVVLYKACLVTGGVVLGYWLDRSLFHYARPHQLFENANLLADQDLDLASKADRVAMEGSRAIRLNASLATLRRTVIILACVLGLTLGL